MDEPTNLKQLRGFIGMFNYSYHDMWPHKAHILAPLTERMGMPKKGAKQPKFVWTESMQAAFKQMKAMIAADILCAYPNHNLPFDIYPDAWTINSFHALCKTKKRLPITARSLIVHRKTILQLTRKSCQLS
jgi:hypothetical protein